MSVSIHAPNEGSDATGSPLFVQSMQFQSTLPMKGATLFLILLMGNALFQSTLPMKGATFSHCITGAPLICFNPRSQ